MRPWLLRRTPDTRKPASGRAEHRRGVIVLEFLFVMPLLVIQLLAILEFLFVGLAHEVITAATISGARQAALSFPADFPFDDNQPDPATGNDIADQVALRMEDFLELINLEIRPPENSQHLNRTQAYVRISRRPTVQLTETASRGDLALAAECLPKGDELAIGEVMVSLCVPVASSNRAGGVQNWLSPFGFTWSGRHWQVTSRALLE